MNTPGSAWEALFKGLELRRGVELQGNSDTAFQRFVRVCECE